MWTYTKEQGLVGTNRWCLHCNHTIEEADLPSYIGQYWPALPMRRPASLRPAFIRIQPTNLTLSSMAAVRMSVPPTRISMTQSDGDTALGDTRKILRLGLSDTFFWFAHRWLIAFERRLDF